MLPDKHDKLYESQINIFTNNSFITYYVDAIFKMNTLHM